jgi:hypothetical protein
MPFRVTPVAVNLGFENLNSWKLSANAKSVLISSRILIKYQYVDGTQEDAYFEPLLCTSILGFKLALIPWTHILFLALKLLSMSPTLFA